MTTTTSKQTRSGRSVQRRRLRVKRCDYVNCCGDVDGCNGIYCDNPNWQSMTPDQYRDYFQKEPPNNQKP